MPDVEFWYRGWEAIVRIMMVGAVGYVTLLVLLRTSGQRTLAQLTPFDLLVTVTIGSAFGRVLTAENVPVVEVIVVCVTLVGLQWLALTARDRIPLLGHLMRPPPSLLYHQGQRQERELRRHRITEADLQSAVRESGMGSLEEAEAIILEPDGDLAVVSSGQVGDASALDHLVEEQEGRSS